jgi:hypothetical protein
MASLYEQYMTSVSAMDQRREQERQLALQQQAQRLRERALAEQIRAAGVSEAQNAQQIGVLRDRLGLDVRQYEDELGRMVTVPVEFDGTTYDFELSPENAYRYKLDERQLAQSGVAADLTRRQLERDELLRTQLGQARSFLTTGDRTDTEIRDYINTLDPEVQNEIAPLASQAFQTRVGAGISPVEDFQSVTDPVTGRPVALQGTGLGQRTRGLGTTQSYYGAPNPYETIFDYSSENTVLRSGTGATRSMGEFGGYVPQRSYPQDPFLGSLSKPAPTPFDRLNLQNLGYIESPALDR